ncbi:type II toxin-antitoxin system HicB family antitoxin [Mycobacterium sp. SA01]|uniref:type II toxin-antitoxin system HicB family antitoxin n=1 Tax=Mycobacterium sp. SA01 TaxID=3238820 RepID=UPI00351B134B
MSRHYTYRAEWSAEDDEYVGLVAEFPRLSWLADTPSEAIAGLSRLVDDILDDMETTGETPPVPFSERRYSGNIALRTSAEQHRRLAIEAAEQGVSLNQWIIYKLSAAAAVESAGPTGRADLRFVRGGIQISDTAIGDLVVQTGEKYPSDRLWYEAKSRTMSWSAPDSGPFQIVIMGAAGISGESFHKGDTDDDPRSEDDPYVAFRDFTENISPNG